MKDIFKRINDFAKGINRTVSLRQKGRFIVNTDLTEGTSEYLREKMKIPRDEQLNLVLDDSEFRNLDQIVVFTNKKIYWTIKKASLKAKNENREVTINGPGEVSNKLLCDASVFSNIVGNSKTIYVLSENIALILPFSSFEVENSLVLAFYDCISNYCGGYKTDNHAKNEILFKNITKTTKTAKINIFAGMFAAISYLSTVALLINVGLKKSNYNIIANETIILAIMVSKIVSILLGNKKSMYTSLLVFIFTPLYLQVLLEFNIERNFAHTIYAGILLLVGIFDFDKVFKYLVILATLLSVVYMAQSYFLP